MSTDQQTLTPAVDVPARIKAAIDAANYQDNGAPFSPFNLKVGTAGDFTEIWRNENRGDQDIVFYKFKGRAGGFLPLGDFAINSHTRTMSQVGALLVSSSKPGVLAHPDHFDWILNDSGSGNSRDIEYMLPIPPPGYSALGICFCNSGETPDVNNYWCVSNDYLVEISKADYWSDAGQGFKHHDGNLQRPVLTQDQLNNPTAEILIVPTTLFSIEGERIPAQALVASQLYLSVDEVPETEPTFDTTRGVGATTPVGLGKVAVLPYTAVPNDPLPVKAWQSPFYYLACEPLSECIEVRHPTLGETISRTVTRGTSVSDAKDFKHETSLSIGTSVGVSVDGFEAGITTTYTEAFSIETSHSETTTTEESETVTITLPPTPTTQFWQRGKKIVLYRTDGTPSSSVIYRSGEVTHLS